MQGVMAGSCESCLSAEQASVVLDAANFTSHSVFKINTVQINAGDLFGGNFKQNAKFTVVTDKGEFNSEELISNFITEGQKYITPIKAASYYVNEKDCEDIIQNEISNNDNSYFAKALVLVKQLRFLYFTSLDITMGASIIKIITPVSYTHLTLPTNSRV